MKFIIQMNLSYIVFNYYVQNKSMPTSSGKSIMCAYKLCKVEFRYWGMQTKIEKFIHEVGEY